MFMLDKFWSGDSPDPGVTPRSGASTPTSATPGTTPRSFASTPARTPLSHRSPAGTGAAVNAAMLAAATPKATEATPKAKEATPTFVIQAKGDDTTPAVTGIANPTTAFKVDNVVMYDVQSLCYLHD